MARRPSRASSPTSCTPTTASCGIGSTFGLRVVNLTDEDPPFVPREMNYDPFTHNPFGRILKVGVTYRMGG